MSKENDMLKLSISEEYCKLLINFKNKTKEEEYIEANKLKDYISLSIIFGYIERSNTNPDDLKDVTEFLDKFHTFVLDLIKNDFKKEESI